MDGGAIIILYGATQDPCKRESLNLTGYVRLCVVSLGKMCMPYSHSASTLIHTYDFWYVINFQSTWDGVNELYFQKNIHTPPTEALLVSTPHPWKFQFGFIPLFKNFGF